MSRLFPFTPWEEAAIEAAKVSAARYMKQYGTAPLHSAPVEPEVVKVDAACDDLLPTAAALRYLGYTPYLLRCAVQAKLLRRYRVAGSRSDHYSRAELDALRPLVKEDGGRLFLSVKTQK